MANIYGIDGGKIKKDGDEPTLWNFHILYEDGTTETIQAHFMGVSVDHGDFFLFGMDEDNANPPIIVRATSIKRVTTLPAKEKHE